MEQRLTLIEKKLIPQYTQGSPLLLEACALHLDNVSKQCIAQLKWKNIGSKPISAVMVDLKCFDTFGHEVKKHQHQYDRLSAGKGKSLGGKEAIMLESDKVSRYEVCLKAVCFEDGKVKEYESPVAYTQLPEAVPHWLTDDMLEQYERDLRQQNKDISVKNDIQEAAGLWQCVCGSWQEEGDACLECHAKKENLIAASSPELIGEHLAEYCERQENDRKNAIYTSAKRNMEHHDEDSYEAAIKQLKSIPGWKDADELISVCQQKIVAIQEQKETERLAREREAEQRRIKQQEAARKRKKWGIILSALVCLAVAVFLLTTNVIIPNQKYDAAVALMGDGKYKEAIAAFTELDGYKDSSEQITACETGILDDKYDAAVALMDEGKYDEAITAFAAIQTHRDSAEQIVACETAILDGKYADAVALMNEGKYDEAIAAFTSIETHRDSAEQIETCKIAILDVEYNAALTLAKAGKYNEAITAFTAIETHRDSAEQIVACETAILDGKYDVALALKNEGKYDEAITAFAAIQTHRDSAEQIVACETAILDDKYAAAVALMNEGKYDEAIAAFTAIETHRDSAEQIVACETAILDGKYDVALALKNEGKYDEAITYFNAIKTHKDSVEQIEACKTAILDGKYADAVALMEKGEYQKASAAFAALEEYKDSRAMSIEADKQYKLLELNKATIGSYITFGSYEQDNNTENGKEDIEWLVLAKENNRLLVISRYALDCQPYNVKVEEVTWFTCSLREWLNNDFLNMAFSNTEKSMIRTDNGSAGKQKVFLLSISEYNEYSLAHSGGQCKPTAYADARLPWMMMNGDFCWWWLRSSGINSYCAAHVDQYGNINEIGDYVNSRYQAVRPALWINLE